MFKRIVWPLGLLILLSAAAHAGDSRIVPGQRVGTVVLGMGRASVHTLLNAPSTTRRLRGGLILDTWLSRASLPKSAAEHGNYLKHDYLSVFFRRGRVAQIEVSASWFRTVDGLSTRSDVRAFVRCYPNSRTLHFADDPALHWGGLHYDETAFDPSASSPAAKHYVSYGDAVNQGIAWKYGAWGDLAPEPETGWQEAVVVHVPGQAVLLNPNDGLPYAGTGPARD